MEKSGKVCRLSAIAFSLGPYADIRQKPEAENLGFAQTEVFC